MIDVFVAIARWIEPHIAPQPPKLKHSGDGYESRLRFECLTHAACRVDRNPVIARVSDENVEAMLVKDGRPNLYTPVKAFRLAATLTLTKLDRHL